MNTDETIREIKAELRASMNGIASAKMRQSGMPYKLAFGVELPRLQAIANEFTPDARLAQALWQENIRECRILATMLYPRSEFYYDLAEVWVDGLHKEDVEIAQQLVFHLLAHEPYAAETAFCWIASEQPMHQLCGFLILGNLFRQGIQLSPDAANEFVDQAAAAIHTDWLPLRKAVQNAQLHYSREE